MKFACAWRGCAATTDQIDELPSGWVYLVTTPRLRQPGLIDFSRDIVARDALLCAVHARELEEKLKPL